MAVEWKSGSEGFRRAQWNSERYANYVVSNGRAALSLEVNAAQDEGMALVIHLPFPVSLDDIREGTAPTSCEYAEAGCYGTSWYMLAQEMWAEHGDTPALWVALESFLSEQLVAYEKEWAHRSRCSGCHGSGVVEGGR